MDGEWTANGRRMTEYGALPAQPPPSPPILGVQQLQSGGVRETSRRHQHCIPPRIGGLGGVTNTALPLPS